MAKEKRLLGRIRIVFRGSNPAYFWRSIPDAQKNKAGYSKLYFFYREGGGSGFTDGYSSFVTRNELNTDTKNYSLGKAI